MNSFTTKLTQEDALKRIRGAITALKDLERALEGEPFQWGEFDGNYKQSILAKFDIHMMSKTGLEDRGYVLKDGVLPIGRRYVSGYGTNIVDLYCLEVQAEYKRK